MSGKKILLGGLAIAAVTGVAIAMNKRNDQDPVVDPGNEFTPVGPGLPPEVKPKVNPQPAALNYNSKFTAADKAHVAIMQKMIGVTPDGAWGSKTEAALPKGLSRPFSLNELQAKLNSLKTEAARVTNITKSGLKVGDYVYAAFTTDIEVTPDAKYKDLRWKASGTKRKQEVQKGQYLGKIVSLNPSSVLILNSFNELVLAPYSKVTKNRATYSFNGLNLL